MWARAGVGWLPFLLVIVFSNILWLPTPARAAPSSLALHAVGEAPLFNGSSPVLVAGIWHQTTVNLESFLNGESLTLKAYRPGSANATIANAYEWVRNEANDSWYDALYGSFLRKDLSADAGTTITFGIGIDAQATPGLWTLEAVRGNSTVVSLAVDVQAPRIDYATSIADFAFRLDPFVAANLSSQSSSQALTITNRGNVPLGMRVTFDLLKTALRLSNPSSVAHVGSAATFYLNLALGSISPQIINVVGTTSIYVAEAIPSSGASVLVPTLQQSFPVRVQVGRDGYALKVVGNVAFETIDSVSVAAGSVTTWQVFLSGSQNASLNVSVAGVKLLGIFDGSRSLALPATIVVESTREHALTVQIEAVRPGTAIVAFTLHLLDTGDVQTFSTIVTVAEGPPAPTVPPTSLYALAGALALIAVLGFTGLNQMRHHVGGKPDDESKVPPPEAVRFDGNEGGMEDLEGRTQRLGNPRR